VTELVAQGLTNRQVAERLFVSRYTVDAYLRSIFRKLQVSSRVDLTRLALAEIASSTQ
jgi:DNA-binding NarL/FixJ family response regulator